jgi:serine/threonine protein kinase
MHITTPSRKDSNCNNNEEAISNQNNNFDCIKLQ